MGLCTLWHTTLRGEGGREGEGTEVATLKKYVQVSVFLTSQSELNYVPFFSGVCGQWKSLFALSVWTSW